MKVARNNRELGEQRAPGLGPLTRRSFLTRVGAAGIIVTALPHAWSDSQAAFAQGTDPLLNAFRNPPDSSKAWAYWWWLDGSASKIGVTADLETMKQQGISGVLLFDSGIGGPDSPKGPQFMSGEWRENFRHAVREAARLHIEMGVNLASGWDAGGPWVTREDAIKDLVWKETTLDGARQVDIELPRYVEPPLEPFPFTLRTGFPNVPEEHIDWYRDVAVIACRETRKGVWKLDGIVDLTSMMQNSRLRWTAPAGRWSVLRLGYIVRSRDSHSSKRVKLQSWPTPSWEIDPMSADAMDRHFAETAMKMIEDAGPLVGKTLKYTHIDSWEIGIPTWTAKFIEEFKARRGYDPTRYLAALADKTLDSADLTARFKWDYRRTAADLIAQNYFGRLRALSRKHGLGTHPESGGPAYVQFVNALETLETNDVPMGEFWSSTQPFRAWVGPDAGTPRGAEQAVSAPFFRSSWQYLPEQYYGTVRQAATAAHIYGKPVNQAEAFTTFNNDWIEYPYFLKDYGDRAFCLGLTRNVLCFYVQQSTLTDKPGYQWEHVGTHFDRNVTWWPKSHAWLAYLARCQHLLRLGAFVADVMYFAGEAIPNFVLLDKKPIPGFDYDVINAHALLTRADAKGGRLTLPGGLSYRYLSIPDGAADAMTPDALRKLKELVEKGMTLVGARPKSSLGLVNYPASQSEIQSLADSLWGASSRKTGSRQVGSGRVIWGTSLEDVIKSDGAQPDVELRGASKDADFDWIHRRDGDTDIYFVANFTERDMNVDAVFRVSGKTPELWDPVSAETRVLSEFEPVDGRTRVPLKFAPKQSWFVVFRRNGEARPGTGVTNFPALSEAAILSGPWTVSFDQEWGGPANATFEQLQDWSKHEDEAIRFFSGTAVYRKTFDLPAGAQLPEYLDLGEVKNLAQIRLNGKDLGVVWTAPWRVAVRDIIRPTGNTLEIEVVNLWPNRLIGDGRLPKEQRRTKTNVKTYEGKLPQEFICWGDAHCEERKKTGEPAKLLPSGLLGPVRLLSS